MRTASHENGSRGLHGLLHVMVAACGTLAVHAQDAQFSQQHWMPLLLDPALAGATSDLQIALAHREQWVPGSKPFRTTAMAFEACLNPIGRDRRVQHGRTGFGLSVVNDRSGTPMFRTTDVQASLAYQLFIDGYSGVGLGIQAGFRQQVFDPLAGTWAAQYNGMRHDPSLPHGESFGAESIMRPDVGAGMYYTFRRMPQPRKHTSTLELTAGGAVFHAARPDLSVFDQERDKLHRRWVYHVQGELGFGSYSFEPAAYLHMQGPSRNLLAGFHLRRRLGDTGAFLPPAQRSTLALGVFTRNGTSLVTSLEVCWGAYGLGMGYDMALHRAVPNAAPMGAAEFAIRYLVPAATGARR